MGYKSVVGALIESTSNLCYIKQRGVDSFIVVSLVIHTNDTSKIIDLFDLSIALAVHSIISDLLASRVNVSGNSLSSCYLCDFNSSGSYMHHYMSYTHHMLSFILFACLYHVTFLQVFYLNGDALFPEVFLTVCHLQMQILLLLIS